MSDTLDEVNRYIRDEREAWQEASCLCDSDGDNTNITPADLHKHIQLLTDIARYADYVRHDTEHNTVQIARVKETLCEKLKELPKDA